MPGVFPDHLRWSATPIPAARKSIPIMAKSPKVWVSPEMGMRKMSVEEERLANIEAKATFAAQLAQRTFVRLVKSGAIDTNEAGVMLEDSIRANRKGNDIHKRVAKQFEMVRKLLFPEAPDI
jgi:hypothetical protein